MKQAKIIILAGQSNAVGVGHVKYLPKHFDKATEERFREGYDNILINYSSHAIKSHGFVKTRINCTEAAKDTLGPEVGIARILDEKCPGEQFFIVKCAFGGTGLCHDWISESNPAHVSGVEVDFSKAIQFIEPTPAGWCYNELVRLLGESIELLKGDGFEPTVCAFCWMQGENDAMTRENTDAYIDRYECLLGDLEARFAPYFENCRYIEAGISEIWEFYKEMNENKRAYAEKSGHRYVDTIAAGLTTKNEPEEEPDVYHYDADAIVKLGELFGAQIVE